MNLPSFFTMSASSTPATCTLVVECWGAASEAPEVCPVGAADFIIMSPRA